MTLDCFLDRFTNFEYCDPSERPTTMKAFTALCERLADETINKWPRVVVLAPSPWCYGNCLNLVTRDNEGDDAFIYLSPSLENRSQAQVNWTVAEEFAHAMVRHHRNTILTPKGARVGYPNTSSERAAKKLVGEWGFTLQPSRPKRRDLMGRKGKTRLLLIADQSHLEGSSQPLCICEAAGLGVHLVQVTR